jgi:hypothetical protein
VAITVQLVNAIVTTDKFAKIDFSFFSLILFMFLTLQRKVITVFIKLSDYYFVVKDYI